MTTANATLESSIWEDVCAVDDLIDNIGLCALVGDEQVAIFKLKGNDELYAISNHDPFSDANVLSRGVVGDLQGRPVVASPIYKQHFILNTGRCVEDMTVKLKTWPVRVIDGRVQVGSEVNCEL